MPRIRVRIVPPSLAWLLLLGLLLAPTLAHAQTPATAGYDPDTLLAIAPEHRADVAASLQPGLTTYDIAVTLPDATMSLDLHGTQTVTYTNTTGEPLAALPFRLYANSAADNNDAITIDSVTIDGAAAPVDLSVDNSVAMVMLPRSLDPGDSTVLDMTFTTTPDRDDSRHYGIFNYTTETQTWSLAHWYPVVAGRDPETGWMLAPTSVYGDPIFTETALYAVTVTAPSNLQLITSGVETEKTTAGNETTTTFNAWPSRDFVIIADADMQSASTRVGATTITSWYEPGTASAGQDVLTWSARALELFNGLLGEYPWLQLNVVSAEIFNAAGVEFPQVVTIDRGYYRADAPSVYFEFTVVHEVVHQWFFNLVGNNQYAHAFIDEGLTNYLSADVYFRRVHGNDAANALVQRSLTGPFERAVTSNTDPIVDFPTDAFPTAGSYSTAAYSKAPLGFAAIHRAMGDDAFFDALRHYVADFRFRVATPNDLLAAFQNATDVDIRPIWRHWFNERQGGLDVGR